MSILFLVVFFVLLLAYGTFTFASTKAALQSHGDPFGNPSQPVPGKQYLRQTLLSVLRVGVVVAAIVLGVALAGCASGQETADETVSADPERNSREPPVAAQLTFEQVGAVQVDFPIGPADSAPPGATVTVPDNTTALKFDIRWRSTTGNLVWSSNLPPPLSSMTDPVGIHVAWVDGDRAGDIALNAVLHVGILPAPGEEFHSQVETLDLPAPRGGSLAVSPTGWGDIWARVTVSGGVPG